MFVYVPLAFLSSTKNVLLVDFLKKLLLPIVVVRTVCVDALVVVPDLGERAKLPLSACPSRGRSTYCLTAEAMEALDLLYKP